MKGLIGGALRGTGQTLQQIGTANMQANIDAEKMAAEEARQMRVLELKQQFDTQNMERESELRLGNTVLDNQLRGEELERARQFSAEQADKEIAAREKLARMQIGATQRQSTGDKAQERLLQMKEQYLAETDPDVRKKLAEDIAFFEGRATAKPEYMSIKNELGAETPYIKTPNGLVPAPILGGGAAQGVQQEQQGPWNNFKGQQTTPSKPSEPVAIPKKSGLISGNTVSTGESSSPENVKRLFNEGIRKAMLDVQQRIASAPTDQERIQLAAQYSELQAKLKR